MRNRLKSALLTPNRDSVCWRELEREGESEIKGSSWKDFIYMREWVISLVILMGQTFAYPSTLVFLGLGGLGAGAGTCR